MQQGFNGGSARAPFKTENMLLLAVLLAAAGCNAHPAYAVQPVVTSVRIAHRSGSYVASAQLRFTLRTTAPALIPSADPGLLDHVQGHLIVAHRVIQSSGGTVEANGSSAAQAHARLNQAIARMRNDLQNELMREERAYDNVTSYGMQQSQGPAYGFPGGPDVTTPCGQ
jgi:hypothetical protein